MMTLIWHELGRFFNHLYQRCTRISIRANSTTCPGHRRKSSRSTHLEAYSAAADTWILLLIAWIPSLILHMAIDRSRWIAVFSLAFNYYIYNHDCSTAVMNNHNMEPYLSHLARAESSFADCAFYVFVHFIMFIHTHIYYIHKYTHIAIIVTLITHLFCSALPRVPSHRLSLLYMLCIYQCYCSGTAG